MYILQQCSGVSLLNGAGQSTFSYRKEGASDIIACFAAAAHRAH